MYTTREANAFPERECSLPFQHTLLYFGFPLRSANASLILFRQRIA